MITWALDSPISTEKKIRQPRACSSPEQIISILFYTIYFPHTQPLFFIIYLLSIPDSFHSHLI